MEYYSKRGIHTRVDAALPMADVSKKIDALFTRFTQAKDRVLFV